MDILEFAKNSIKQQALEIDKMGNRLNDSLIKAVEIIRKSKGHLVVAGVGKSGLIGKKISATFSSIGKPSFFIHPTEGGHGDLGSLTKECAVVAISNSGNTKELLAIIPFVKENKIPLIVMTGNLKSNLAKAADVVLDISVDAEVCPLNLAPTTSTTATLVMGDALAVTFLKTSNFSKEDFAKIHPQGKLGLILNNTVSSLLTPLSENACLYDGKITVRHATIEITKKRQGCAVYLSKENKLLGIFTDGDLRRLLQKYEDPLNLLLEDVVVKNPRSIDDDTSIAQALDLMNNFNISSLPVLNKSQVVVGLLHLKDIYSAHS